MGAGSGERGAGAGETPAEPPRRRPGHLPPPAPPPLDQKTRDALLREYFRLTFVQQALLILLAVVCYCLGVVLWLIPHTATAGAVFFIIGGVLFFLGIAWDFLTVLNEESAAKALEATEPEVAAEKTKRVWWRWLGIAFAVVGGLLTIAAGVMFLPQLDLALLGMFLFFLGLVFFDVTVALVLADMRITELNVAWIRGEPEPPYHYTWWTLLGIELCLVLYTVGCAALLYIDSLLLVVVGCVLVVLATFGFVAVTAMQLAWLWHETVWAAAAGAGGAGTEADALLEENGVRLGYGGT